MDPLKSHPARQSLANARSRPPAGLWAVLLMAIVAPGAAPGAAPGDVLITEIMKDPFVVADELGEWFEVFNTTGGLVDMNGWTIEDADGNVHRINNFAPLFVPPRSYLVLGINRDLFTNGGAAVDYQYTADFRLNNGADGIILYDTLMQEVDRVFYDGGPNFPDPKGASLQLVGNYKDRDETYNDAGANWRASVSVYGWGDLGTPGLDNDGFDPAGDSVPPVLLGASLITRSLLQVVFDEPLEALSAETLANYSGLAIVDATQEQSGDKVLLRLAAPLAAGQAHTLWVAGVKDLAGNAMGPQSTVLWFLVPRVTISEIMYNSRHGDDIEWIELYAPTNGGPVDLGGWYLTDDEIGPPGAGLEGQYVIPEGTVLQPDAYLVVSSSPESLHDIPGAVLLEVQSSGALGNGGDELSLWDAADAGGTLIDGSLVVPYPDLCEAGRSLERVDVRAPWSGHALAWQEAFVVSSATPDKFKYATPGRPNGVPLPDADGDRIPDMYEAFFPLPGQTNMYLPDSDGDGLSDWVEDDNLDLEVDLDETDPRNRDTDGDGLIDGVEVAVLASNPLDPNSPLPWVDLDGDGLPGSVDPDDQDRDTDGDRYADAYEAGLFGLPAVNDAGVFPSLGDLNLDSYVSNLDSLIVQSIFLELTSPTAHHAENADPNRDGFITNLDSLIVQTYFLENLPLLPL